jgi:four helix bundle protein
MKTENIIQKKSFDFALHVIKLYNLLKNNNEYVLSKQLLRCGTSIGANVEEASAGQTKKDFITKMAIASKEARETKYWLRLIKESNMTDYNIQTLIDEVDEIIKILTAIVKTSQENLNKDK